MRPSPPPPTAYISWEYTYMYMSVCMCVCQSVFVVYMDACVKTIVSVGELFMCGFRLWHKRLVPSGAHSPRMVCVVCACVCQRLFVCVCVRVSKWESFLIESCQLWRSCGLAESWSPAAGGDPGEGGGGSSIIVLPLYRTPRAYVVQCVCGNTTIHHCLLFLSV